MTPQPRPFSVDWSEQEVSDVMRRVAETPAIVAPAGRGWDLGCDPEYLAGLREHWLTQYDWRAALDRLNRYPQHRVEVDGVDVHFVHVVGEGARRRPLLLTHGWPSSPREFWDVVEPLAFPSQHGGRAEDAFDVVLPSLPGYGFSGAPDRPVGPRATAQLWDRLMTSVLGHDTYLAHGGDWGGVVTSWLGLDHRETVRSIHLTLAPLHVPAPPEDEAERAWLRSARRAARSLSAYSNLQATKPLSLALAAAGSPLGQAAWIVERFHDWSDLRERPFEDVHPFDTLLDNVMIYVLTGCFSSSVLYYRWNAEEGGLALADGERCLTPTAFARFPVDAVLPPPPRSRVERAYDVVRWSELPRGGHFPALESPDDLVADLRAWGAEVWPQGD